MVIRHLVLSGETFFDFGVQLIFYFINNYSSGALLNLNAFTNF